MIFLTLLVTIILAGAILSAARPQGELKPIKVRARNRK